MKQLALLVRLLSRMYLGATVPRQNKGGVVGCGCWKVMYHFGFSPPARAVAVFRISVNLWIALALSSVGTIMAVFIWSKGL